MFRTYGADLRIVRESPYSDGKIIYKRTVYEDERRYGGIKGRKEVCGQAHGNGLDEIINWKVLLYHEIRDFGLFGWFGQL